MSRGKKHKQTHIPPPTAETLFQNAQSYLAAAACLVEGWDWKAGKFRGAFSSAFYLLAGFAIELSLKALCLRSGVSLKDVECFRHDLHRAYLEAVNRGKIPADRASIGVLVLDLSPYHRDLTFRYTPAGTLVVPLPPPHCVSVLQELIDLVRANW